MARTRTLSLKNIKVVSFDVTGTLLIHKFPIVETYSDAAKWAQLQNPPKAAELKEPFKQAYKTMSKQYPSFRIDDDLYSSRRWWAQTLKMTLELSGRHYNNADFDRYFRRVYQHYGSLSGYEVLPDVLPFLDFLQSANPNICMGITTNTPMRTVETVIPMMGLHDRFNFFVCCQDIGFEKPGLEIYQESFEQAKFWCGGDLQKDEVLHIGDNLAADFCGPKQFGFDAILLDRSKNKRVNVYQDWLTVPDYDSKSEQDIIDSTVEDLMQIKEMFLK